MTQRERQILNWIEENPLISQQELAEKAGITRSSVAVHISNLMKKGYITGKGYIVHTAPYVTVVGGVNMDIGGWPSEVPVGHDSNPGVVRMSLGGVGRNIAHNMSLLGLDVRMVTAFGDDLYAQKIAASCGELGIDVSQCPDGAGGRPPPPTCSSPMKRGDMGPGGQRHGDLRPCDPRLSDGAGQAAAERPADHRGHQHSVGVHRLAGGQREAAPLCRPGVHRQGGKAASGAGQAPHPEAQPAGGGAFVPG